MSAAEKWMRQEDCTIVAFPEVNSQKEMAASVTREEEKDKRRAGQRKGRTDSGGADEDETGTKDGTDFASLTVATLRDTGARQGKWENGRFKVESVGGGASVASGGALENAQVKYRALVCTRKTCEAQSPLYAVSDACEGCILCFPREQLSSAIPGSIPDNAILTVPTMGQWVSVARQHHPGRGKLIAASAALVTGQWTESLIEKRNSKEREADIHSPTS
ncbi:hypothetical protein E4U19_003482 [Claviceps sp. Clav32 group G5]|nr:hypothetical protein E4U19_003482 [Claviceps sp. Clav32 group G5]